MRRIAVIGNSGGGKSVLARVLAERERLPYFELDAYLWDRNHVAMPDYEARHADLIAGERWVLDGMGLRDSIARRLARATHIVLIDMPLWMHYALAADRQTAWAARRLEHPPGGLDQPPKTAPLFQLMWQVDRDWMPEIRERCVREEAQGKSVTRVGSLHALSTLRKSMLSAPTSAADS